MLSRLLMPKLYASFPKRTQINWDVHVVSFVQSVFICTLALWGMRYDAAWAVGHTMADPREALKHRLFATTVTGGAVTGYAVGYFIWDLFISVYHVAIMGPGFVAHGFAALLVFSLGFVRGPLPPARTRLTRAAAPVPALLRARVHPV